MTKLYKENDFRDNCGFGLIASIDGVQSRRIVKDSINALVSMTHRGGIGSDGKTGDGCGLLVDINPDFYIKTLQKEQKVKLENRFAVGQLFYFQNITKLISKIDYILSNEGLTLVAHREVPTDTSILGNIALECLPNIYQLFIQPVVYINRLNE